MSNKLLKDIVTNLDFSNQHDYVAKTVVIFFYFFVLKFLSLTIVPVSLQAFTIANFELSDIVTNLDYSNQHDYIAKTVVIFFSK